MIKTQNNWKNKMVLNNLDAIELKDIMSNKVMDKDAIADMLTYKTKVNSYIAQQLEGNSGKRPLKNRMKHGYFEKNFFNKEIEEWKRKIT